MNAETFETKLYDLLADHINGQYDIAKYLELLNIENSSILNYILSHAYYELGDMKNAEKYRNIAAKINSNIIFEQSYENILTYIYLMYTTITTQTSLFKDDEIDELISDNPSVDDFLKASEAYRNNNDISNAIRITKLGQEKFPNENSLQFDLASNLLYSRNVNSAWEYNEKRFDCVRSKLPQYIDKPKFELQNTSAKVYIYPVTKFGDTIFFSRYIFKLKQDYPDLKLIFSPDAPLRTLFEENGIKTYDKPEIKDVDYQISVEGLAYLYKDSETKVLTEGYLKANKEKSEYYRCKYLSKNKLNIGFVWNTSKQSDIRNIPLELFEELFSLNNTQFYALQKDVNIKEELNLSRYFVPCPARQMADFSDTAAFIENLDIVIGCDTSVTNLSGAMGKNTIIILPTHADWRWELYEQNSNWYKSVKLFRKKPNQGYEEVFDRVKKILQKILNSD